MSHRRWLIPVLAVIAVVTLVTVAQANHSWGSYHWARQSNPFTVKLGDDVSSTWDSYLSTASSDWSASSVLNTSIVAGSTSARRCRPTSGRVEVCNSTYGNTGWLGVAQIWVSGSHITQGTVKLNDTYHNQSPYNQPAWRRLVMCQEVGHTFGLDHQDENFNNGNLGTCMDYTSDPDGPPSNEHPNSHDYSQLESIYSHLDSTTTVGASVLPGALLAVPAVTDLELSDLEQWGRLVATSRDGGQSVFEADFGHGVKVITHVTWIPEVARGLATMGDEPRAPRKK
jgi:hypothetical protein